MSRRRNPKQNTDSKRYFDWLYHANIDYKAAVLLSKDERCYLSAAFHCQQSIEKALKGFLLFKKGKLFDGHNLTWLCRQAVNNDKKFAEWIDESATLNRYYIETRYPADTPLEIDHETLERLMAMTGDMLDFIAEKIRFDFLSYHKRKK